MIEVKHSLRHFDWLFGGHNQKANDRKLNFVERNSLWQCSIIYR